VALAEAERSNDEEAIVRLVGRKQGLERELRALQS
jgi:hypothetical protein